MGGYLDLPRVYETVVIGPHVAATFPKRPFPYEKGSKWAQPGRDWSVSTATRERYLDLLEKSLFADEVTMLSPERLRNIRQVIEEVQNVGTPGHFIETGVWRGGGCIYARAVLSTYNSVRRVYVADSFAGLPPPDPRYPEDAGDTHHENKELAVSLDDVRENFEIAGFSNDEQVIFVQGWFDESLPALLKADPELCFSVIRLDGDMYGSTMDALVNLYDRLSPGGFCIIDDFCAVAGCQKAVNQFRHDRGIEEPMWNIDGIGIFWQKETA